MDHKLPFSTAECDECPKIEFQLGKLRLSFDVFDGSDKRRVILVFDGALRVNFTPDTMVSAEMIEAYSKICEFSDSEWLQESKAVAEHAFSDDCRHYRVYFDHYGCVDALATGWRISE